MKENTTYSLFWDGPYSQWDPADFDLAFEQAIPGSNVLYGMKEYIGLRQSSALAQLEKIGPYIKRLYFNYLYKF